MTTRAEPFTFIGVVAVSALTVTPWGCSYERDVGYKPFFTGLEGSQLSTPASDDVTASGGGRATALAEPRMENEDGSITLVNATGRHLMANIIYCLDNNEAELFVDQVLSQRTINDANVRGHDPAEIFDILEESEDDVRQLFMRMPFGEHSPSVLMKSIGPNEFEVSLTRDVRRGLRWSSFTMIMERGGWRLVWFGG